MDKVKFFYNPQSRARIVHWMLEESGAPYSICFINFNQKDQKSPEFLKVNPMGKIPAIVHRGTVVTESAAICSYLADAFPNAKLSPSAADPQRGSYLRWMFFLHGCVEPAIVDKMFNRPQVERVGANGYGTFDDTLNTLESALNPGPFVLGNQFSAADVCMASAIGWGIMMKAVEPRPAFQQYLSRCHDRPAFSRFMEQANAYQAKINVNA